MCASFSIHSSTGDYGVRVASGLFAQRLLEAGSVQFLADDFFRSSIGQRNPVPVFIKAEEQAKSLHEVPALIEQMRRANMNRSSHLVALGGGIIQDISAFACSIYMRGIPWSYMPTTVLGMVDSCIGGKSSINVGPYKNLVGTFYPPTQIDIDPALAATLPAEQIAAGLIEAAKITFCRGPVFFAEYLANGPEVALSAEALQKVILCSLSAKKHFIELDEFDQKERLLLNFGHTFGHALEGATNFSIPHGIAVGLGILCSLAFQNFRGVRYSSSSEVSTFEAHLRTLINAMPLLKERLAGLDPSVLFERLKSDKKHGSDSFTLILASGTGEVVLERHPRTPAIREQIYSAFQAVLGEYE